MSTFPAIQVALPKKKPVIIHRQDYCDDVDADSASSCSVSIGRGNLISFVALLSEVGDGCARHCH